MTDPAAPLPFPTTDAMACEWCSGWEVVYACAHCARDDSAIERIADEGYTRAAAKDILARDNLTIADPAAPLQHPERHACPFCGAEVDRPGRCVDDIGRGGNVGVWLALALAIAIVVVAVLVIVHLAGSATPRPAQTTVSVPWTELTGAPHGEGIGRASDGSHDPVASSRVSGDKGPTGDVRASEESITASPAEFDLATGGGQLPGGAPQAAVSSLVTGQASWYRDPSQPADGLYAAVHSFRWGDPTYPARVCRLDDPGRCVTVTVRDHMAHPTRVIDLSPDSFKRLAPLSQGVVQVTVEVGGPRMTLPPTDTAPSKETQS